MSKKLAQIKTDAKREGWADWLRCENDESAALHGYWWDKGAADRARRFFETQLCHSKGRFAGKPFKLLDWQYERVIAPVFGWVHRDTKKRRFRHVYYEIPKKNGKSTLASGIALKLLCGDGEQGAHVFSCAADRDQASIVYTEAANMAASSPELNNLLKIRRSVKRIYWAERNAVYEAISSDADSAQGLDAHGIIMDELHAWKNRDFYESLMYAGRARDQPLIFIITTAGDATEGICWEQHQYAERLIAGEIKSETHYAWICAADGEQDWKAPATWQQANPSYGVTMDERTLREDCNEAQESPAKENAFKRYSLNQWVGASDAWLSMDVWRDCAENFTEEEFYGHQAWGGIDLSATRDLSAVVWVVLVDDVFYLIPRIYVPGDDMQAREKADHVPYWSWSQQGYLRTCQGSTIDYGQIRGDVLADAELFDVQMVGYDPHNALALCQSQLELEDGLPMVSVSQTMGNMAAPAVEFESLLKARRLHHNDNKCLNWMAAGCAVYEDTNGNYRPVKRRSTTRIDGIIAAIIALGQCQAQEPKTTSIYSERGPLVFDVRR